MNNTLVKNKLQNNAIVGENNDIKEKVDNPVAINKIDLKEQKIKMRLDEIKGKGVISNQEEYENAFNYYKKMTKDLFEIENEINKLTRDDVIKKFGKIKKDPNKVSLENIRSFTNPKTGKSYISIHYSYPNDNIKLVHNYSNIDVNTFFNENKDDNNLVSVSGIVASTDIYENSMQSGKKELGIKNVSEYARRGEFSKLSRDAMEGGIWSFSFNH